MTIPHAAADGLRVVYLLRAPAGQVWDAMTDTRKFGFWFGARLDGVFAEAAELTGRLVPTQVHPGLGRLRPGSKTGFSRSPFRSPLPGAVSSTRSPSQ